ncbi:MAG: paraquat-inducible protein A [Burkholderiales bacterium]|nr:paraquat-inducible protein A [Phycisphaerae bacterium]
MSRTTVTWTARLTILLAAVLLGIGLVAPCMRIVPHFGAYDSWVRLLRPSMGRTSEYSVLSGILTMIEQRHLGVGLVLLFFSCVFPTLKLAVMAWGVESLARGKRTGPLLQMAHHTGKFSMLDVLVLALIVIAIKGLPGSTEVQLGWGVWMFATSVVLSLLASILLHRLEQTRAADSSAIAA